MSVGETSAKPKGDEPHNVASAIIEVSERASLLVREEIELAKAEVVEKGTRLVKGAVVGAVAGVFVITAVMFALIGFAWLLYFELPIGNEFTYFWGFFIMAAILLLLGGVAGFVAAKVVKAGSPPTPNMAIEEARKIRETVSSGGGGRSDGSAADSGADTSAGPAVDASVGSAG